MVAVEPTSVEPAVIAKALKAIRPKVTERQFNHLHRHFESPNFLIPDEGLGSLSPTVMLYGKIGGAISKQLGMWPGSYHFRWLVADRRNPKGRGFSWQLHPNFVEALEQAGWFRRKGHMESSQVTKMSDIERDLEQRTRQSMADTRTARLERLRLAPKKPEILTVLTTTYNRNPDVIAEVLLRAQGRCESCRSPAPFRKASDGAPYLEVHHVVRLADGGDDTEQNAIAVCPNCHRKHHFG